jgi:hypothetical protein
MALVYTVTTVQEIRDIVARHGDLNVPWNGMPGGHYNSHDALIVQVTTRDGIVDFYAETPKHAHFLYQALV